LYVGLLRGKVNWVLDLDIRGFLDPSSYCPQVDEVVRKGRVDHRSP
jgi:hypothetical protein